MTENETTDLPAPIPVSPEGGLSLWVDDQQKSVYWRAAEMMSKSKLIPEAYQNSPVDCFVALGMAKRLDVDPFLVLQNLQSVKGKPSFSASFLVAIANQKGPFEHEIRYIVTGKGPSLSVEAYTVLKSTGERVSRTASMEMARMEGWTKNPKYNSIPEQMLHYRAATFLIRQYWPEGTLGMHTRDEHEDVYAARTAPRTTAAPSPGVADLNAKISGATAETVDAEITPKPLDAPHETPAADAPERPF